MSNKTLIIIGAVVVVILASPLILQAFKATPTPKTEDPAQNTPVEEAVAEVVPAAPVSVQPAPRQPAIMTQMQFNQICPGMTYEQCVQFIGCEGERARSAGRGGDAQYTWQIVDSPYNPVSTGEATLTFRNGMLSGRGYSSNQGRRTAPGAMTISARLPAQRPATPPYICRSVYDGIKNGSTYAECVQLLGIEGTYLGRRAMSGGTFSADGTPSPAIADVFVWHNPAVGATLTLSFRDGKLTAREVSTANGAAGGFGGIR